jgi:hypothetical protein
VSSQALGLSLLGPSGNGSCCFCPFFSLVSAQHPDCVVPLPQTPPSMLYRQQPGPLVQGLSSLLTPSSLLLLFPLGAPGQMAALQPQGPCICSPLCLELSFLKCLQTLLHPSFTSQLIWPFLKLPGPTVFKCYTFLDIPTPFSSQHLPCDVFCVFLQHSSSLLRPLPP